MRRHIVNKVPLVSIVVTCFNLGKYLKSALESIREQTYRSIEVIVIDDESTDSKSIHIFNKLEREFSDYRFIRLSHRGVEEARNYGISQSKGTYICVLDADDKFQSTYIEKCVNFLIKHTDCSLVTTYVETFGEEKGMWFTEPYDRTKLLCKNILHVSSLYKREVFESVKGYDKEFEGYSDWEFWINAASKGFKWGLIRLPLFLYRIRKGSMLKGSLQKDSLIYSRIMAKYHDFFESHSKEIIRNFREELMETVKSSKQLSFERDRILYEKSQISSNFEKAKNGNNEETIQGLNALLAEYREKIKDYESERNRLIPTLQSFNQSRYLHARHLIKSTKSYTSLVLLPLKLVYVILPKRIKNYWRKIKERLVIRLYSESLWDNDKPLVSIIIPVYNYGRYVQEAVDSITNQTFTDYEVVIVEGGSTDGESPALVKNVSGRNIRKFYRKKRHYPGSNRDYGIKRARGKYIVCLDADDVLDPTYLEKTVFVAEAFKYDIVGSWLKAFGKETYVWRLPESPLLEEELQENSIIQSSLFRKDLYFKIGGYKDWVVPNKSRLPEDWEFWVRMLAAGARVYNIPEILFYYRVHQINITSTMPSFGIIDDSKKIQEINRKVLTKAAFRRSRQYSKIRYINLDITRNIKPDLEGKENFYSAIPLLALGGADLVYQQVEKIASKKYNIHLVADVPVFPEQEEVFVKHKNITPRVYEVYKMIPYSFAFNNYWNQFVKEMVVKYLLKLHPPSVIYQGGSKLWYKLFPFIKSSYSDSKIIDNQFNHEGYVNELLEYCDFVDTVMVENEFLKKFFQTKLPNTIKIKKAMIGVDTDLFRPQDKSGQLLGKKIDLRTTVVTYLGRFSPEKGVDVFLECAKANKNKNVLYVLVGYGPLEEEIRQKIEKKQNAYRNVLLLGCSTEPWRIYSESDIVVVPSILDGAPNVVKEAMASGLVVIGSKVGGIPEMIPSSKKVGFICGIRKVGCINNIINRLASDPTLLELYKSNARKYALQQYSKEDFTKKFRGILNDID